MAAHLLNDADLVVTQSFGKTWISPFQGLELVNQEAV